LGATMSVVRAYHKHINEVDVPYKFVSVEKLVTDFLADIERIKHEKFN
jgi:hypothetical protein